MIVRFHKQFEKKIRKLRVQEKRRFKERLALFINDPSDPTLSNHALKGKYKGYSSINITGDLRALYKIVDAKMLIFVDIDTHSNLYR